MASWTRLIKTGSILFGIRAVPGAAQATDINGDAHMNASHGPFWFPGPYFKKDQAPPKNRAGNAPHQVVQRRYVGLDYLHLVKQD